MRLRELGCDRRGVVMAEFLICFVPVLLIFLGTLQLTLIAAGKLVVQHAAVRGVRAAIVVLTDDPRHYDDRPCGDISDTGSGDSSSFERRLARRLGTRTSEAPNLGGPRMADIRRAVHTPLMALAPPALLGAILRDGSVADALRGGAAARVSTGLLLTPALTATTFPTGPGSRELQRARVSIEGGALVTVRVTHAMPCLIPFVGRLTCAPLAWSPLRGQLELPKRASEARRAALEELRVAPSARLQRGIARSGLPFALLQAEASLPAQHAAHGCHMEQRQ